MNVDPQLNPPRRPGIRRVALTLAAGFAIAAVALALIPPAGRPQLPANPEARGEALEQALVAAVTKVRDPAGESWAIAIDPADINAWLATRLPKWIAHDPELAPFAAAERLRLGAEDGAVVLDAPVGPGFLGLVGTVRVPLELDEQSQRLRIDVAAARVGRLPIPFATAGLGSGGALADEVARLEERYPGRRFRLADGRFIELRAISCEEGRIKIRFATLPAGASGR